MTLTSLLDRWTEEAWAEHARGNLVAAHTYWRCREELARALTEGGPMKVLNPVGMPVYPGMIWGRYPSSGGYHPALDFPCPIGTPVRAPVSGRVTRIGWDDSGYGWHVRIRTDLDSEWGGSYWILGHNSDPATTPLIEPSVGDWVAQGAVVMISNSTGRSSGPHVHLEGRRSPGYPQAATAFDFTPYIMEDGLMPTLVSWREGSRFTPRGAAMLTEVARLTPTTPRVRVMQSGFNPGGVAKSAGTHDREAVDLDVRGWSADDIWTLLWAMRLVGWAAWYRPENWDGRGGVAHIHAVPIGGDLSPSAARQVDQYKAGRNGLANKAPDPTPAWVGHPTRTWEQYLAARDPKPTTPKPQPPAAAPANITEALMAGRIPGGTGAWHSITMPPDGKPHRVAVSYSGAGPRTIKLQPHRESAGKAANVGPEIAIKLEPGVRAWRDMDPSVEQVSLWWDGAAGQSIEPVVVSL